MTIPPRFQIKVSRKIDKACKSVADGTTQPLNAIRQSISSDKTVGDFVLYSTTVQTKICRILRFAHPSQIRRWYDQEKEHVRKECLLILIDANARIGGRLQGCGDGKVLVLKHMG